MAQQKVSRTDRFHPSEHPGESQPTSLEHRSPGQRDRDRILYTSAFRRLAGVTQVVSADEGHVFHNRLTHTLEVAQVARRTAEKFIKSQSDLAESLGGIDPDVAEAAALAHDLGHPPFGHIGEEELDKLAVTSGVADGFEGNPQSFRIVNNLALRTSHHAGLNLTRATLCAIVKYPWLRGKDGFERKKRGAYASEEKQLNWCRELFPVGDKRKSIEAEIMDWADDVTYAVHDMSDFYQAGLIPFEVLTATKSGDSERRVFFDGVFKRSSSADEVREYSRTDLEAAFESLMQLTPLHDKYRGTKEQRAQLRSFTAGLIAVFVNAIDINPRATSSTERRVTFDAVRRRQVFMLKQLTWHYVILNPALSSKQHGQRRVVRGLFEFYGTAALSQKESLIFPYAYHQLLEEARSDQSQRTRIVTDLIASMTEEQAVRTYLRLSGTYPGSALDHTVR